MFRVLKFRVLPNSAIHPAVDLCGPLPGVR
jgi:hypothetical protein